MKTTNELYNQIIIGKYLSKLKINRDRLNFQNNTKYGMSTIINLGGDDYIPFDFIMKNAEFLLKDMLLEIVRALIEYYEIKVKWYIIQNSDSKLISFDETRRMSIDSKTSFLSFIFEESNGKRTIYIFKEFGILNRIDTEVIKQVFQENNLDDFYYISLTENNAYEEVLNHNNDESDITRGTRIYSIEQFFNIFFNQDEYLIFKKYAELFEKEIQKYYGLSIVRTLTESSVFSFKQTIHNTLQELDIASLDQNNNLSEEQKLVLKKFFYQNKNFEVLLGNSDFAQSFITSEWLFDSLSNAENIDLTIIAMGYFKTIEQILFDYIKLHTLEKDEVLRKIFAGNHGLIELKDDVLNNDEYTKNITLGNLVKFFGDYKARSNSVSKRNEDLLNSEINIETYNYVIEVLSKIVGLRNGYFHKHNLKDWDFVRKARNHALLILYLFLGAYKLTEKDKIELGLIEENKNDLYYKLCQFTNKIAISEHVLEIPIFYTKNTNDKFNFWVAEADPYIEYKFDGNPIYSGVYLKRLGDAPVLKMRKEDMPDEMWYGKLVISRSTPVTIDPTGPIEKIYSNGEWLGKGLYSKILGI